MDNHIRRHGIERYAASALIAGLAAMTASGQLAASSQNGASWSPDGSRIAFHSNRSGGSQLFVMQKDGSHWQQITFSGMFRYPKWSPNGKTLISMGWGESDKTWSTYRINADGSGQVALETGDSPRLGASISPDGKIIAFCIPDAARPDIWLVDADGSNLRNVTGDTPGGCWPRWSPDGKRLTFGSPHATTGDFEIAILVLADGTFTYLTESKGNDYGPVFSSDGQRIYFNSQRDGGGTGDHDGSWKMLSINLKGADLRVEAEDVAFDSTIDFSPDGRFLTFATAASGEYVLMQKNLRSGAIQPIVDPGSAGGGTSPGDAED